MTIKEAWRVRSEARGNAAHFDCAMRRRSQQCAAQDQQGYRPHITIQNKVTAEQARRLYTKLADSWEPFLAVGEGLLLWRYLGGPWALVDEYRFVPAWPGTGNDLLD